MARDPMALTGGSAFNDMSGWTDSFSEETFMRGTRGTNSSWQRCYSAGDVIGILRSPKVRRRPFDHRGVAEELLTPKNNSEEVFRRTMPAAVDPGGRIWHGRYQERAPSEASYRFSQGTTPAAGQSMAASPDCSPIAAAGKSPMNASISPMSTKAERSLKSTKPPNEPQAKKEDRALDFWPLGEGCRIMHHIEPKKFRPIALTGDFYQGHPRNDWSDVQHLVRIRERYPAGRDMMRASQGPFPQGRSQEELRKNRNYDRSHGSQQLAHGMMRVGSQVMFL